MFGRAFCTPDDAGGRTRGIETGMGTVTFVGSTELTMGFGAQFWPALVEYNVNSTMPVSPFSDNSLPAENRRLEGDRMLRRRPEKDISIDKNADSWLRCQVEYSRYSGTEYCRVAKYLPRYQSIRV